MQVVVTDAWRAAFPHAHAGVLVIRDVQNRDTSVALDEEVRRIEATVRQRHSGTTRAQLAALPPIRAYQEHYRRFGQSYHLIGQLESVALKAKPLASPGGPLVTAMFAAEIDHLLLTAGHDADVVQTPLVLDASVEGDRFVGIGSREQVLHAGDMVMRDDGGLISAVLSGPDERTRVRPVTTRVVYVTYAPRGVSEAQVREHLDQIARLVTVACPGAEQEDSSIYPAD